jgi:hypothetical protein
MAIFRPEEKKSSGSPYLGVIEVGIIGFSDRAKEFDFADIFLEVELSVKGSEYSNKMAILGSLDKDASGNITGGSVLNRMYKLFDAIGCNAGLNVQGVFEDENGNTIDDIATCQQDTDWLKSKGVIKEADASDMPQQNDTPLAANALNNL